MAAAAKEAVGRQPTHRRKAARPWSQRRRHGVKRPHRHRPQPKWQAAEGRVVLVA